MVTSHTSNKTPETPKLEIPTWISYTAPTCHLTFILKLLFPCSFSSLSSELLDCDDLHSVIRLVLKAGNYMNAVGIFLLRITIFKPSLTD